MPELVRDSVRIHYEVVGRGAPVLLMHGGYVSSDYWTRAGYVDALSGDHTLVLLDFRGHGRSSQPRDEASYGLHHDVADAVAAMDAAGIPAVTACGWSWGGTTGLAMAALHPQRVNAVLAISSSGRHGRFSDLPADLSWAAPAALRFENEGLAAVADAIARDGGGHEWMRETVLANDVAALAAWARAQAAGVPIGAALADITQPVVLMPGELEFERLRFPRPILPRHARLRVVPGAGHAGAFMRTDLVIPALRGLTKAVSAVRS